MQPERIELRNRTLGDEQAAVSIVRARIIRWKHHGCACDTENKIVQLEGSEPRRFPLYLTAKCGHCHQVVRLYEARGRERWTIDPTHF